MIAQPRTCAHTHTHTHTHTTACTVGTLSVLQSARGREGQVIEWKPFFLSPAWCGFRVEAGAVTSEPFNSEGIAVTLVLQALEDREGFLPMHLHESSVNVIPGVVDSINSLPVNRMQR